MLDSLMPRSLQRRTLSFALAALLGLAAAPLACALTTPLPPIAKAMAATAGPPTPLLWKVSKGETTVYLLGSMHMLRDGDYPLSPDVEAAYKDAEKLAFEITPAELKSPATMALTLKYGMYTDPAHTLKDDLPAATWPKLVAWAAKNGLPEAAILKFKPWLVALTIVALESKAIGMDPEQGLDMHFAKVGDADKKLESGLETVDFQLSIFYSAPMKEQIDMLQQGLEQVGGFAKDMNREHDAWRRGDGDALIAQAKKEFAKYPELYQKIVAQRNRNWVSKIEAMLADPKDDTLLVVGALHLPGPDGVVHLLQQKGYKVERVCTGCSIARGR